MYYNVSVFVSLPRILDWIAEAVPKAEVLRLIYQGRFLHCNVTLHALSLPLGKTTVMHLVPRDNLPEPNSQGKFEQGNKIIKWHTIGVFSLSSQNI